MSVLARFGPRTPPLAVAAGALVMGVGAYLSAPGGQSFLPSCILHSLTGINCPGCGGTRAVHALLHGDFVAAIHNNVFTLALIPVFVALWVQWYRARVQGGGDPFAFLRRWAAPLGLAMLAFFVLRNIPVPPFTWLAPIPA